MISGLFTCLETVVPFLQYAVTLYSMHCLWPIELWFFAITIIALCGIVVFLHVKHLWLSGQIGTKAFEMILTVLVFLLPPLTSPYFHFHHWFAGWLVGMHCNLDVWWSRFTMAWCWGAYINGIAVYGRDPILTCAYSFYYSYSLRCPYLQCYVDEMRNHTEDSTIHIMQAQDWRNCTVTDYTP